MTLLVRICPLSTAQGAARRARGSTEAKAPPLVPADVNRFFFARIALEPVAADVFEFPLLTGKVRA